MVGASFWKNYLLSLYSEFFCFPLLPLAPPLLKKQYFKKKKKKKKLKYSFIVLVLKTDFVLTINDVLVWSHKLIKDI